MSDTLSRISRIALSVLLAIGLVSTSLTATPADALAVYPYVVCVDQATTNTIGIEVPASGQSHVFARYRRWNGSTWATVYQSPVNPLPQSVSYGQYIQVSTFYLPGFMLTNVGAGHYTVDLYSYYPGVGWKQHNNVMYQWNGVPLSTKYCTMG